MNRAAFYDALRPHFGALTTPNVMGFELCLNEAEKRKTTRDRLAYILATAWWETGKTMASVEEAYYLGAKADGYRRKLRYFPYYGRGLVQLTWKDNYRKAGEIVGVDLVSQPTRAMEPKTSVAILFDGMERGWFTGKRLADYIDDKDEPDSEDLREFANARRIVNGTDRQIEIGKLALKFETALKAAGYGVAGSVPSPVPVPPDVPKPLPKPPVKDKADSNLWAGILAVLGVAIAAMAGIIVEWFK